MDQTDRRVYQLRGSICSHLDHLPQCRSKCADKSLETIRIKGVCQLLHHTLCCADDSFQRIIHLLIYLDAEPLKGRFQDGKLATQVVDLLCGHFLRGAV